MFQKWLECSGVEEDGRKDIAIYFVPLIAVILVALLCKTVFRRHAAAPVSRIRRSRGSAKARAYHYEISWKLLFAAILTGILYTSVHIIFAQNYEIRSAFYYFSQSTFLLVGTLFLIRLLVASFTRVYTGTPQNTDKLYILIPVYNEDESSLRNCLRSCLSQTLKPTGVFVVDDGSTNSDYAQIRAWFEEEAKKLSVKTKWERLEQNKGKRDAHIAAFKHIPKRDMAKTIVILIDSDTELVPYAN